MDIFIYTHCGQKITLIKGVLISKILKNTTGSSIYIKDVGVTLIASPAIYTIPPQDYPLWAASTMVLPYLTNGNIVVNDGLDDLKPQASLLHLTDEGMPRSNSYVAAAVVQPAAAGTATLTSSSRLLYIFTGNISGQIAKLPNATTLNKGHRFEFWSKDSAAITIQYDDLSTLSGVGASQRTTVTLSDNTTTNGVWLVDSNFSGGGGSGTDLDSRQFGRQGNISANTFLLTVNNIASDESPDICSYDYFFRRISWANSNNAGTFTIRIWRIDGDLNPSSKFILYDHSTSGRTGTMNFDVNTTLDEGQGMFVEIISVGNPKPANLNVIVQLRQR